MSLPVPPCYTSRRVCVGPPCGPCVVLLSSFFYRVCCSFIFLRVVRCWGSVLFEFEACCWPDPDGYAPVSLAGVRLWLFPKRSLCCFQARFSSGLCAAATQRFPAILVRLRVLRVLGVLLP